MRTKKMMNITIDPEVLTGAATDDDNCKAALLEIEKDKAYFSLVRDKGEVRRYYSDFMQEHLRNSRNRWIARLLESLINDRITSQCPTPSVPTSVQNCTNPHPCPSIEKQLLRIAAKMNLDSPTHPRLILLVRCQQDSSSRCLYKEPTRSCLRTELPGVEIICADRNRKLKSLHKIPTNEEQHVDSFERQTGELISHIYNCLEKYPHATLEGEQIDVYRFQKTSNPKLICVGECKLRFENEENPIELEWIKQLERKIKTVIEFEISKGSSASEFDVMSFIISNAKNLEDNAWTHLKKIGGKFLRIKMPNNWQSNPRWSISKQNLEEIPFPADLPEND